MIIVILLFKKNLSTYSFFFFFENYVMTRFLVFETVDVAYLNRSISFFVKFFCWRKVFILPLCFSPQLYTPTCNIFGKYAAFHASFFSCFTIQNVVTKYSSLVI